MLALAALSGLGHKGGDVAEIVIHDQLCVGFLELFREGDLADERANSGRVGGPRSESWFFGDGLV